ncbi:MAG: cell division protein SepF [Actinomycetota bacterium]|nr:cell division protein SepF [Actinomycetota bacterium]
MAGMWRKTLVYLGLAEEDEPGDYDYDYETAEESPPPRRARADGGDRSPPAPPRNAVVRAMPKDKDAAPRVHLVQPTSFNDAQEIGDKFREGFSVLMNLQSADQELGRRLVDFASGLAYGLHGSMQPAADRVFLITPRDVEVSAEDRRRVLEERGFFNQV